MQQHKYETAGKGISNPNKATTVLMETRGAAATVLMETVLMETRGDGSGELSQEARKRKATEEVAEEEEEEEDLEEEDDEEGVHPVVVMERSKHGDGSLYESRVDVFRWLFSLKNTGESK